MGKSQCGAQRKATKHLHYNKIDIKSSKKIILDKQKQQSSKSSLHNLTTNENIILYSCFKKTLIIR